MKAKKAINGFFFSFMLVALINCSQKEEKQQTNWKEASWEKIEASAENTEVNFMMWQGSPVMNNYINNYVIPALKEKYKIDLKISSGQGPEIVQLLMNEKQAASDQGQIDMVWINGETFFQLRKIEGLYGPFVQQLPNAEYIDFDDPFISIDFQQNINNMEAPWGISQFAFVYDSAKVANPPKNLAALSAFVKENPGTFTISNDFSGMTLLKAFLAELGGSPNSLDGSFDQQKYDRLSDQLWQWINENKQYFWKDGSTFPKEHSRMDQMFASGELLLSYGFAEGGIEEKVIQGLFPKTTRGYAWKNGTVLNSNYLGITYNAKNIAGALTVINFLLSPEAQLKKADPGGANANTVLDMDKLPEEWQKKFQTITTRQYGPSLDELRTHAIKEPAPEYMLKLYEDFRTHVIEK